MRSGHADRPPGTRQGRPRPLGWRRGSRSPAGAPTPRTFARARCASCFAAAGDRPRMSPMSVKGTAKVSWSTNANRSVGASVSSTTSSAAPIESASTASASGSASPRGSTTCSAAGPMPASGGALVVTGRCRGQRVTRRWSASRPGSWRRRHRAGSVVSMPPARHGVVGVGVRFQHPVGDRLRPWTVLVEVLRQPVIRVHVTSVVRRSSYD